MERPIFWVSGGGSPGPLAEITPSKSTWSLVDAATVSIQGPRWFTWPTTASPLPADAETSTSESTRSRKSRSLSLHGIVPPEIEKFIRLRVRHKEFHHAIHPASMSASGQSLAGADLIGADTGARSHTEIGKTGGGKRWSHGVAARRAGRMSAVFDVVGWIRAVAQTIESVLEQSRALSSLSGSVVPWPQFGSLAKEDGSDRCRYRAWR